MPTDQFLSMFTEPGRAERPDPVRAAQAGMKPGLPRRFYADAAAVAVEDGRFRLALDGRPARTPARNLLAVDSAAVAGAIADEWRAQREVIDPATMPLTRLVNAALDGVAAEPEATRAEVVRYAGSDLICYRAEGPEALAARQSALWDPVLAWARDELGARLNLAAGVMHVPQDDEALARVSQAVAEVPAPLPLAALASATSLTGSALLSLALARGFRPPDEVWDAAHVDESYQAEIWGRDEEAEARLALRRREFDAAAFILTSELA